MFALPVLAVVSVSVSVALSACGTSGDSTFGDGVDAGDPLGGQNNQDGSFGPSDAGPLDPDAFFAKDPPPMWCGPDGGGTPPVTPGGSVDCPDDKNRQGCPCSEAGAPAPCWPGLRANRGMGVCVDGVTTCTRTGEFGGVWGPCVGYTLPTPGATSGKAACKCFSEGQWKIENLIPYFETFKGYGASVDGTYAISTYQDSAGKSTFPAFPAKPPPAKPTEPWSADTLKVDCAGHFKLCYELKAGDAKSPLASDCSIVKVCTDEFDYAKADVEQALPKLPGWLAPATGAPSAAATACADSFHDNGGYGEMSVVGKSVLCDAIDDGSGQPLVFNRIQYCKAICSTPDAGSDPSCASCGQDGSGVFH